MLVCLVISYCFDAFPFLSAMFVFVSQFLDSFLSSWFLSSLRCHSFCSPCISFFLDISIYLQLLPRSSCFYRLFQQIEYSIEDCEIIHKIPSLSSSHRERNSRKIIKTKKSTKNKSKTISAVTALTRHE
jgi:hypothetical protein